MAKHIQQMDSQCIRLLEQVENPNANNPDFGDDKEEREGDEDNDSGGDNNIEFM
ncbi:hypothetical protein FRC06_003707, partial [Ceratobasidium sp. 370]